MKRFDRPLLGFLSKDEIQAILDAPPSDRWTGQRDQTMLATLYNLNYAHKLTIARPGAMG
jgi:site-specific recombinase XerD